MDAFRPRSLSDVHLSKAIHKWPYSIAKKRTSGNLFEVWYSNSEVSTHYNDRTSVCTHASYRVDINELQCRRIQKVRNMRIGVMTGPIAYPTGTAGHHSETRRSSYYYGRRCANLLTLLYRGSALKRRRTIFLYGNAQ